MYIPCKEDLEGPNPLFAVELYIFSLWNNVGLKCNHTDHDEIVLKGDATFSAC